jgi:hypothetical protein
MTNSYINSQRVFICLTGIWVGLMMAVGLLVPMTIFSFLTDKQVAGMVAGQIFKNAGIISIIFGMSLLLFANTLVRRDLKQFKLIRWCLLGTIVLSMIGNFIIQPWMVALRENTLSEGFPVLLSSKAQLFQTLHGVSSSIFLVELGLLTFVFWRSTKIES